MDNAWVDRLSLSLNVIFFRSFHNGLFMSAYSLPGPAPPYQRMGLVGAIIDTSPYLIPSSVEGGGISYYLIESTDIDFCQKA